MGDREVFRNFRAVLIHASLGPTEVKLSGSDYRREIATLLTNNPEGLICVAPFSLKHINLRVNIWGLQERPSERNQTATEFLEMPVFGNVIVTLEGELEASKKIAELSLRSMDVVNSQSDFTVKKLHEAMTSASLSLKLARSKAFEKGLGGAPMAAVSKPPSKKNVVADDSGKEGEDGNGNEEGSNGDLSGTQAASDALEKEKAKAKWNYGVDYSSVQEQRKAIRQRALEYGSAVRAHSPTKRASSPSRSNRMNISAGSSMGSSELGSLASMAASAPGSSPSSQQQQQSGSGGAFFVTQ